VKKDQERCDGCGKWVDEFSLIWLYGTYDAKDKCVCKQCYAKHEQRPTQDSLDSALPIGHSGSSLTCPHPYCVAERNTAVPVI